jgi:hypothetical protein
MDPNRLYDIRIIAQEDFVLVLYRSLSLEDLLL